MKLTLLALSAATLLAGCATHSKETIMSVRRAGVSERTVHKLEHKGVLQPTDLVELRKRGVSDAVPLRQLDKVGVDYIVRPDELKKLRAEGVRPIVTDALLDASDEFRREHYEEREDRYESGSRVPWWVYGVGLGIAAHALHRSYDDCDYGYRGYRYGGYYGYRGYRGYRH